MAKSTARWGFPYPELEGDSPDVPLHMENLAKALDAVAMDDQGALSSRPAAGEKGRYYYATDNGVLYRDTGSSWVAITTKATGGVATSTENLALTGSYQSVPGCEAKVSPAVNSILQVVGIFDMTVEGASGSTGARGNIRVDGGAENASYARLEIFSAGKHRASVAQVWSLSLAAGEHAIDLRAKLQVGTSVIVNGTATQMLYTLMPS